MFEPQSIHGLLPPRHPSINRCPFETAQITIIIQITWWFAFACHITANGFLEVFMYDCHDKFVTDRICLSPGNISNHSTPQRPSTGTKRQSSLVFFFCPAALTRSIFFPRIFTRFLSRLPSRSRSALYFSQSSLFVIVITFLSGDRISRSSSSAFSSHSIIYRTNEKPLCPIVPDNSNTLLISLTLILSILITLIIIVLF